MNGRLIDVGLITAWLTAFFVVAIVHPGLANMLIALLGGLLLGWYNTLIRHDPADDTLRPAWQAPATTSAASIRSGDA
jgi:hypothetical protein